MFRKIDENGNGMLSLLETRQGMFNIFGKRFVDNVKQTWK
jgi:hypothetical protein